MSYILDALKKSQHARQLGKVPTIDTSQLETEPRHGAPTRWIYSAVIMALIAILVAAYGIVDKHTGVPSANPHDPSSSSPVLPTPRHPGATPGASPTPRMPVVAAPAPSPAASYAIAADMDIDAGNLEAGPVPFELFGAEAPTPSPAASPTPYPEMTSGTAMEHEQTSSVPVAEVGTAVPLLRQLSPEFRQTVPPMSLDVHVYRTSPARRFVLINETMYRQGEHTAEGLVVEEIAPDGVILSYRGKLFRLES